jgi:integrase
MSVRIPKYRLHRGSGQALIQINGQRIYLGVYDSPESQEQYRRLVAEFLATGQRPEPKRSANSPLTIDQLILAYFRYATGYYQKDGKPTDELDGIRSALRRLRQLYGRTLARDFGPMAFKLVREAMVQEELSRKYINDSMSRIRRMFRWAVAEELVSVSVHQALATVPGLRRDRSKARETEPVAPVADEVVEATLDHMPPIVADMVRLQRLTGCRP